MAQLVYNELKQALGDLEQHLDAYSMIVIFFIGWNWNAVLVVTILEIEDERSSDISVL